MIIAIPTLDGQVSHHFGKTRDFTLFTVEEGKVISTRQIQNLIHSHDLLGDLLKENGVELVLCGGGTYNLTLRIAIARLFPGRLLDTGDFGIDPMEVEAAAFAWLAERFLRRLPGNLPAVTHASGPRLLGALYPH